MEKELKKAHKIKHLVCLRCKFTYDYNASASKQPLGKDPKHCPQCGDGLLDADEGSRCKNEGCDRIPNQVKPRDYYYPYCSRRCADDCHEKFLARMSR